MVTMDDIECKFKTSKAEAPLVRSAIDGDPEAFAQLYLTYGERILRFVLFRVGDEQLAEDLTSQTFLKAWEKLGNYQMRGLPFGAWLFRIARNIVFDHYRNYRETVELEASLEMKADPSANVVEVAEKHLEADLLQAALRRLTEEQRQVLMLKFNDGMSTTEVAKVMGKRCGAVRALQMRGLQSLQRRHRTLVFAGEEM